MQVKDEIFTFDHTDSNFHNALGVSSETDNKIVEIVFFSAISNHLLGRELFDNEDDIPKSLMTVTGDLEKSLKYVNNQLERDYLLLVFRKFHEMAVDCVAKYGAIQQSDGLSKRKILITLQALEIKLQEDRTEDSYISPTSMFKRIKCVIDSKYNFDKYMELLREDTNNDWLNAFMNGQ